MIITLLFALLIISFGTFLISTKHHFKYFYSFILHIGLAGITSYWAFSSLFATSPVLLQFKNTFIETPYIYIDKLSAFFILVINFTSITGFLYANEYLKPYYKTKTSIQISIHYFSYFWLHTSMVILPMLQDGYSFLVLWEIMSITSFLLVAFDAQDKNVLRTALNYLIQMHVGLVLILIGFLIVEKSTGEMSFTKLGEYFENNSNVVLFLLFFVGFGIKAGFIPLHTWLPQAHPAAPSHVSGVMSGVMIKLGIYGILRVLTNIKSDWFTIAVIILVISLITGILGIMFAIAQRDLKRMLAYSSIENIGIIGIGMGVGSLGIALNKPVIAILGFTGCFLHIFNHSLFKSLLFFSAGAVYKETHTKNIELLGGIIKKMPKTAFMFLIGSMAICALPPLNGFISELIIYSGLFNALHESSLYQSIFILCSIIGLTVIGGLALFAFTKTFGIAFLGNSRSHHTEKAKEVKNNMIVAQLPILILIVAIGFIPMFFVLPISKIVQNQFQINLFTNVNMFTNLNQISIIAGLFVVIFTILILIRYYYLKQKAVHIRTTWGCGYTAGTARHQYTSSSFADHFGKLANPILNQHKDFIPIREDEIFPLHRKFVTHTEDIFKTKLIDIPVISFQSMIKRLAILQTGQIQHYILYAFGFMFLIFILSYLGII